MPSYIGDLQEADLEDQVKPLGEAYLAHSPGWTVALGCAVDGLLGHFP